LGAISDADAANFRSFAPSLLFNATLFTPYE
jgi:hypothetical protein